MEDRYVSSPFLQPVLPCSVASNADASVSERSTESMHCTITHHTGIGVYYNSSVRYFTIHGLSTSLSTEASASEHIFNKAIRDGRPRPPRHQVGWDIPLHFDTNPESLRPFVPEIWPNNVFNLSATYDLDLWPKILKIFVSHGVPIRNMYAKFHNDRLRNGWDITLWNFAKTRTNTQTHKHTNKQGNQRWQTSPAAPPGVVGIIFPYILTQSRISTTNSFPRYGQITFLTFRRPTTLTFDLKFWKYLSVTVYPYVICMPSFIMIGWEMAEILHFEIFAKTRTNKHTNTQTHKQTDMGITIPRPPPMGGEVTNKQTDMGITIPRPPPMGGEVTRPHKCAFNQRSFGGMLIPE